MADKFWYFVMAPMVYLSVAWCVVGIVVRIMGVIKTPDLPKTLRIFPEGKGPNDPPEGAMMGAIFDAFTMPSIRKTKPLFWVFLMAFHAAFALLILAHLDLFPQLGLSSPKSTNMLGYGAIGLVFTICALYFLFRRFRSPVREVSVPADYIILFVLVCLAISGDIISWGNSWTDTGFVLTKQDFGAYLTALVKFNVADPKTYLAGGHFPVIGTHVLFANLFLILLPFSKIMHFAFAVPLNKLRRG
jgi:nitrate reductase gamma subunit